MGGKSGSGCKGWAGSSHSHFLITCGRRELPELSSGTFLMRAEGASYRGQFQRGSDGPTQQTTQPQSLDGDQVRLQGPHSCPLLPSMAPASPVSPYLFPLRREGLRRGLRVLATFSEQEALGCHAASPGQSSCGCHW